MMGSFTRFICPW